ncbi:MAG: J domain-containing protein [Spirochaetes bacterium]|nr:J domain-containing protein [Spirochaetota bacterium]
MELEIYFFHLEKNLVYQFTLIQSFLKYFILHWCESRPKSYHQIESFFFSVSDQMDLLEKIIQYQSNIIFYRIKYQEHWDIHDLNQNIVFEKLYKQAKEKAYLLAHQIELNHKRAKKVIDFYYNRILKNLIPLAVSNRTFFQFDRQVINQLFQKNLQHLVIICELTENMIEQSNRIIIDFLNYHPLLLKLRVKNKGYEKQNMKKNHRKTKVYPYFCEFKLPDGAPLSMVKESWIKMMKQYHPDLHCHNRDKQEKALKITQQLNKAYGEIKKFYKERKN